MRTAIFILINICIVTAQSYRPLSGKEKNLFSRSYKDLKTAYSNGDYKNFQYFAAKILAEYENILLDPSSAKLRSKYMEVDSLNKSLQARVNAENKRADIVIGSTILTLDQLISLYKNVNNDSAEAYQKKLLAAVDSVVNEKLLTLEFYREANICKNIPDSLLLIIRKNVEVLFQERFLELSSKLEFSEIRAFEAKYPEIYQADIKQLKDKAQKKERLTNLRFPSFEQYDSYAIKFGEDEELKNVMKKFYRRQLLTKLSVDIFEEYYKRFPEDDFQLFATIEDKLYQNWLQKGMNDTDGALYMKYFPQGRYVYEIRNKKQPDTVSQNIGG